MPRLLAKKILLYDPTRRPPDWTGLLSSEEIAVFLTDVHTSQELNAEGEAVPSSTAQSSCYVLAGLQAAEQFSRELIERFPNMRCELFDRRGRASDAIEVVVHPSHESKLEDQPRRAKLLIACGALSLSASIPLFYFDWTHEGFLIWPSLIAVNCVGVGLRLTYWGWSILQRKKRQS